MAERGPVENPDLRVGRYELVRKIATGGMAELFLARFTGPGGFEKRCALKRILPQFVEDEDFKRMFMNEARVAAMFDHPNLVQIFELGQSEETLQFYIAMELINGMDLRQLQNLAREQGQSIPPELAAWMMCQCLDGLAYAHEFKDVHGQPLNLVHRDISPQNLLVSYEGALKVVDFGIVKAASNDGKTQTGMLKGKIAYMSPEQTMGDSLDSRSDLFAIGICLYELIAGVKPFRGPNEIMTLRAILEQDPAPITHFVPDCPRGIERAIYRALAKRRDDRYQSAREFQMDLLGVLRRTPLPIDRHVMSDFMRTLTEGGTDRFDATKLKIPRIDTSPGLDPFASGARFAGTEAAAPSPHRAGPSSDSAGRGVPKPPREAALAPQVAGNTEPDVGADREPLSVADAAKAAGISQRGPALLIAGLLTLGAAAAVAAFLNDPGEPVVVSTAISPPPVQRTPPPVAAPVPAAQPEVVPVPVPPEAKPVPAAMKPVPPAPPTVAKPVPKPTPRPDPVVQAQPDPPPPIVPEGLLDLTSVPRGLHVTANGKKVGITPLSGQALPAGAYTVVLSNEKLGITKSLSLQIRENQTTTEKLTVGRGSLEVNSRPWSEVYVDGEMAGKTPLKRPIYEGKHQIRLVAEDGQEQTRTVEIKPGEDTRVLVKF